METWKSCPSYPGYCVNQDGIVKNEKTGKIFTAVDERGYIRTGIERAHIMVADAWLGKRPDGLTVDHINRIKTDNKPSNLRYVSVTENNKNRGNFKNNKLNEKYICYCEKDKRFHIEIGQRTDNHFRRSCETLEEAIKIRDEFLETGEKQIAPRKTGEKNIQIHHGKFRVLFEKKDKETKKKIVIYKSRHDTLEEAIAARDKYLESITQD